MKKDIRKVYKELAYEVNGSLCTFCKYADWQSEGCCEGYAECNHPIEKLSYQFINQEDMPPSEDCWGFKSNMNITLAADITGVVLSQKFDLWFYRKYSKTSATVYGQNYDKGQQIEGKVRIG